MKKIFNAYLKINYSGQKTGNPWNVKEGLLNTLLIQISIILSGVFFGIILLTGLRSMPIVLSLVVVFNLIIWRVLKPMIKSKLDYSSLEDSYIMTSITIRILYFILSIIFIAVSFILMILSIKLILLIGL